MGIEIKCDLDELRPSRKTGLSPAHGVLCEVIYPEHSSTTCLLLVIKLSMTGNEPELIVSYKQRFPKFPNQPTSDQFFDEHQFEAYRRLGTHRKPVPQRVDPIEQRPRFGHRLADAVKQDNSAGGRFSD